MMTAGVEAATAALGAAAAARPAAVGGAEQTTRRTEDGSMAIDRCEKKEWLELLCVVGSRRSRGEEGKKGRRRLRQDGS